MRTAGRERRMIDEREQATMVWVLTDGKIGDEVQCLAVAAALSPRYVKKTIAPRPPWEWLAPWGPVDPRDAPGKPDGVLAPPFPDIAIASGRRAVPYALAVKRASGGRTFCAMLKDPRIDAAKFDFVWAPAHDRIAGANVFKTLTSPHGLGPRIAAARGRPATAAGALPAPMLGVIVGGPSGGAAFDEAAAADLAARINTARASFASVAVVPSRRTPDDFLGRLSGALTGAHVVVWEGEGDNPYTDILANAAALIVTADSHNMMSEALATGTGVYVWRPRGLAGKLDWFVGELEQAGAVRPLAGAAEPFRITPINATDEIVMAIRATMAGV